MSETESRSLAAATSTDGSWWDRNWRRVINLGLLIAVVGCAITPPRLTWKPYEIVVRVGILVFYTAWLCRPKRCPGDTMSSTPTKPAAHTA